MDKQAWMGRQLCAAFLLATSSLCLSGQEQPSSSAPTIRTDVRQVVVPVVVTDRKHRYARTKGERLCGI